MKITEIKVLLSDKSLSYYSSSLSCIFRTETIREVHLREDATVEAVATMVVGEADDREVAGAAEVALVAEEAEASEAVAPEEVSEKSYKIYAYGDQYKTSDIKITDLYTRYRNHSGYNGDVPH